MGNIVDESQTALQTSPRKRRIGVVASYIYTAAQVVVNLLYVPLLLRGIGQAEYGLYQMIGSMIAYMAIVNTTLSAGVTRYYCKYYAEGDSVGMANTLGMALRLYRRISAAAVVVGAVLAGVVRVVYAGALTPWQLDEGCLMIAVLVCNLIVTMNNTVSIAAINAHEEFAFLRLSTLVLTVLQPVAVVVAIAWFPNALAVCLVQFALNCVLRLVQHGYAKRRLGIDTRLREYDANLRRGLLHFSGGILLAVVADQVFWKTDQLILGYLYGPETVAVYAVGFQVVMAYMSVGTAISGVFMPRVSEICSAEGDYVKELDGLFLKVSRIALYPLLLVLTGFVVFGQSFVAVWAGDGFSEAYWVAVVVMVPFTIDVAQNIGLVILQVLDKYFFRAVMYFVTALANIALTVVMALWLGCIGAAISTGVSMLISSGLVMNVYYAKRLHFDMKSYWASVAKQAAPLLVLMAAGIVLWNSFNSAALAGSVALVVGIAVYSCAFAFVAFLLSANAYERGLAQRVVRKVLPGRG